MSFRIEKYQALHAACTHVNCSSATKLAPDELAQALVTGNANNLNATSMAMVASVFEEVTPQQIAQCANDAGVGLAQAAALYSDLKLKLALNCPHWEDAIAHLY